MRRTELKRSKPLERKTALTASPLARSTIHAQQAERRQSQKLVKGRRHVNGMPAELGEVLAELSRRGERPSGDLLNRARWAQSLHFKLLPDKERMLLSCLNGPGECWEWAGSLKENGYGQFRFGGKSGYAHRAAYVLFKGPIPAGLTVDHQCHNLAGGCKGGNACPHRRCVNPSHLELTDQVDNARRGVSSRTHCPRGHDLEGNRKDLARCRQCLTQDILLQSDKRSVVDLREGRHAAKAKISDADIDLMRGMKASGRSLIEIAGIFGITAKYLSAILSGSRKRKKRHPGPTPSVRRMVARRSGGQCEFVECPLEALHQHHRRPRRMGSSMATDANLPANLFHLCLAHHEWVESNRERAYADGLLLHMNENPTVVPVLSRHGRVWLTDDGTYLTTNPTAEEATA